MSALAILLSGAIAALLAARAVAVIRRERGQRRGARPAGGFHVIRAEYMSGLGGQISEYRVPKDPQAYARLFVPANRKEKP